MTSGPWLRGTVAALARDVERLARERDDAREALRAAFSWLILARATMRTYLKHGDRGSLEAWLLAAEENGWLAAEENGWLEEIRAALAAREEER